jgi:putative intracellular protease/amidase
VRVLIPLPDRDFDVTEVAVPWRVLTDAGHDTVFATERGDAAPMADPRLLDGVIFGKLGAYEDPKRFYRELAETDHFRAPVPWPDLRPDDYDALLLPGGHAPGMRQYLSSPVLQTKVAEFWQLERPVGAICHGVLVLARARDPVTGQSVIAERQTTCLPKYMERGAYYLTAWRLGRYYRTYPAYVEDEVTSALAVPSQFVRGPRTNRRGTATDHRNAFVVEDGRYLSARWPGDAYLFAERFRSLLEVKPG